MTVNKERLQLALDAMRSGEYKQTQRMLCRQTLDGQRSYCCLGVMTDVAVKNGLPMSEYVDPGPPGDADRSIGWIYDPERDTLNEYVEYSVLHSAVRLWYGLGSPNPTLVYKQDGQEDLETEAAGFNDCLGASLSEIADLFEATYLKGED